MTFTSATLSLADGNDIFYTDSGPVPNSTDYTTLVFVHGSGFNSHSFEKLHQFSAKNNFRTVALNRRDYPGSTPYSDVELDDLKNGRLIFLHQAALTMAHFVASFVKENNVPRPNKARNTGGVIVVGWSAGTLPGMLWLEGTSDIPAETCDVLNKYVTRLVLYGEQSLRGSINLPNVTLDPPYFALGLYLPKSAVVYDPWKDPDCKTVEELFKNFKSWVSSYFDTPPEWSGDVNALDCRKHTGRNTVDTWTEAEQERYFSMDASLRSEYHFWNGPMISQIKSTVTRCLYDEKLAQRHLPNIEIIYITCRRSCWHTVWATHEAQRIYKEYETDNIGVRPMRFVSLEEANHLVHYDDPQALLNAIRGVV